MTPRPATIEDVEAARRAGDLDGAEKLLTAILAANPAHAPALHALGRVRFRRGDIAQAAAAFRQAAAADPTSAVIAGDLAVALNELGEFDEALTCHTRAIAAAPNTAHLHYNHGVTLQKLGRQDDAVAAYDRAIALNPSQALAWHNRGAAQQRLQRYTDALTSYDGALALQPAAADTLHAKGEVLLHLNREAEAVAPLREALRVAPETPYTKGLLLYARMLCCDWDNIDALADDIATDLRQSKPSTEPFGYQAVARTESDLMRCAELYAAAQFPPGTPSINPHAPPAVDKKIRIGYLCGEFRDQATSVLMTGIYECHDKARFHVTAFDNGWDDGSALRQRINAAFDEIIDIRQLSDEHAAAAIAARGIDILVNLNGYFGLYRQGVFARRPAPVQVNYLGFPGTLGASYIDYLIADRIVLPPASRPYYTEKIVTLPDSYQANDDKRPRAQPTTRADAQLPSHGVVFCCFNATYKFTPSTFESWMRILGRVPDSVLWLLETNPAVAHNLRREAERRDIAAERLLFAPRMPFARHLSRMTAADLFLDTLPYNAHTTAADALWSGLPVLTQTGNTFPGRVGASLLTALGLPELITTTPQSFEDTAVRLATHPSELTAFKSRLAQARTTAPLFNTARMTRHLEAAYQGMIERRRAGLPPADFDVVAQAR